jgi:prepilin-type N-terminal cleavage/methylation domain-containing protein
MVTTHPPCVRNHPATTAERGYTLVELLLAVAIGLVLMASAVFVAGQVLRASNSMMDGSSSQEEGQYAMDWMTAALRSAGANPYGISTSACPAAGTVFTPIQLDPRGTGLGDNVRVQADLNPPNGLLGGAPGVCTETNEDVTIWFDRPNQSISRTDNNTGGTGSTMTDRVISDLRFVYLDAARAATAVPSLVAYVQVSLTTFTASRDAYLGRPLSFTLTSEVRIRLR